MFNNLLKTQQSLASCVRHISQQNKKHIYKDGEKFANTYYYPR